MKVAFLGTGNMGRALIAGVLRKYSGTLELIAWDKNSDSLSTLDSAISTANSKEWFEKEESPDAVVIAVKP